MKSQGFFSLRFHFLLMFLLYLNLHLVSKLVKDPHSHFSLFVVQNCNSETC